MGQSTLEEVWVGSGSLEEVQDVSVDIQGGLELVGVPNRGPGWVGGPSGRSGTRLGDPQGGPGRVGGPSRRSGMGQGTHGRSGSGR